MQQRSITELAYNVLKLAEARRGLEIQMDSMKDELAAHLAQEGTAELIIPTEDPDFNYVIKNNLRYFKTFDKEGLAIEIRRDKDELDYEGISKLVESGHLKTSVVAKFQEDSKSEFITVRRKKALGGKK